MGLAATFKVMLPIAGNKGGSNHLSGTNVLKDSWTWQENGLEPRQQV